MSVSAQGSLRELWGFQNNSRVNFLSNKFTVPITYLFPQQHEFDQPLFSGSPSLDEHCLYSLMWEGGRALVCHRPALKQTKAIYRHRIGRDLLCLRLFWSTVTSHGIVSRATLILVSVEVHLSRRQDTNAPHISDEFPAPIYIILEGRYRSKQVN